MHRKTANFNIRIEIREMLTLAWALLIMRMGAWRFLRCGLVNVPRFFFINACWGTSRKIKRV